MDEMSIRNQLEEVRTELERLDTERQVLLDLHSALEAWLRVHPSTGGVQLALPEEVETRRNETKGEVSTRSAVLQVLKQARGEPLLAKEILKRAEALGARTTARRPASIIDLTAHSLQKSGTPIEKVDTKGWRWIGDQVEKEGNKM